MVTNNVILRSARIYLWNAVCHAAITGDQDSGKSRLSWNDNQIKKLREMWLSGATDGELISAFGRSANAIAIKAHRLGLPPRAEAVATNAVSRLPVLAPRRKDAVDYPDHDERAETNIRPKAVGKVRNCLMCGGEFWSSHAGERVCSSCKSTEFWRNGAAVFGNRGGGDW